MQVVQLAPPTKRNVARCPTFSRAQPSSTTDVAMMVFPTPRGSLADDLLHVDRPPGTIRKPTSLSLEERQVLGQELVKLLVGHMTELVYMGGLDLLDVEAP